MARVPQLREGDPLTNDEAYAGMGGPPVDYPPKPAE